MEEKVRRRLAMDWKPFIYSIWFTATYLMLAPMNFSPEQEILREFIKE